MSTLVEIRPARFAGAAFAEPLRRPAPRPSKRRRYKLLFLVIAAGFLLFCHGCHADEDVELLLTAQQKSPRAMPAGSFAATHLGRGTSMATGCDRSGTFGPKLVPDSSRCMF